MAHVASGSAATSAEYNAHDDRIQNLENSVITQGGAVGSASLDTNIGWKQTSASTSSNGRITVTHNLGWTPRIIATMAGTSGPYAPYIISPTTTQFTVQFYVLSTGAAAAGGQAVVINWLALPVSGELS